MRPRFFAFGWEGKIWNVRGRNLMSNVRHSIAPCFWGVGWGPW